VWKEDRRIPLRRSGRRNRCGSWDADEAAHLRPGDRSADTAAREAHLPRDRGEGQAVLHDGGVAQDGARIEHAGAQTAAPECAGDHQLGTTRGKHLNLFAFVSST
jgi:hypothetical protein